MPWRQYLQDNTNLSKSSRVLDKLIENITNNLDKIKNKWKEVPDWRLGQLLVNEGYIPDYTKLFYLEEDDWLIEHKACGIEDIKFWGSIFDKEMNRLPQIKYRLLKDLEDAHIQAILDMFNDGLMNINEDYRNYFNKRLEKVNHE